jgi:DNA processing protein
MLGVQSLGPLVPRRAAEGPSVPERRQSAVVGTAAAPRQAGVGRAADDAAGHVTTAATERDAWVTLMGVSGLGPVTFAALLEAFGSATAVLVAAAGESGATALRVAIADGARLRHERDGADVATPADEASPVGRDPAVAQGDRTPRTARHLLLGADLAGRIRDAAASGAGTVELARSLGLAVVTLDDVAYPARLRAVEMPPPVLFVRGSVASLAATHAVAVVGTRRATDRGRLTAAWISSGLVRAGAAVVSGLAVGIDGAAHAAAVGEGGVTVAVLGSGHARLFPRAHERLADAIVEGGGAVVSEYPPETVASRGTFPRRNRVVSGLADAVVVVEAGVRSGALITAGWALEQGRDCFLVPGAIDAAASAGCNAFLRAFPGGARVVCGVPELIEDLGLVVETAGDDGDTAGAAAGITAGRRPSKGHSSAAPAAVSAASLASLGPVERLVAELLAKGPATADDLAARSGLTAAAVLSALTLLELRGLVAASFGRYVPAGPLSRGPATGRRGAAT